MKISIQRSIIATSLAIMAKEIQIVPKKVFKSLDKVVKKIETSAEKLSSDEPLLLPPPVALYTLQEVDGNIEFNLNPKAIIETVKTVSKPTAQAMYQIGIAGASMLPIAHTFNEAVDELKAKWLAPVEPDQVQETVFVSPETTHIHVDNATAAALNT